MDTPTLIPINLIDPNPWQPRGTEDPEVVAEIAASIKKNGMIHIPTARQVDGRYQLAAGHTRLAAYRLNGEECIPLFVRDLNDIQMFEVGNAENIKRRDLTVIEKARAMQRYMEEFGKSSVEAGELFGVSPESVRGTVRYLDLPEDVQGKLARGEITQAIARSLLSIQKIAGAEVIVKTAERLESGKDPRWNYKETPEEAIEETLDSLKNVKVMWHSYQTGKPRGGSDGWLLDMKNFPNKLLPVLAPEDLAIALGVQNDESVLEQISAAFNNFEDWELIHESLKGSLADRPELLQKIEHLVNPPSCTACPFYSVLDGRHYCGMEICFDRKTRAWDYERLRAASKDLGIQIYDKETDGAEFRVLEDNYRDEGRHHKLFKDRNKDLRLALAVDIDRKKGQSGYKGVPARSVVMVVGKTLKNLLSTGQKERAEKRTKEQAAALLENLRTEKRHALEWEVAGSVKTLFDGMNLAALNGLWDAPTYGNWNINRYTFRGPKPTNDDKPAVQEEYLRRLFALNMVKKIGGHYRATMSDYAATLSEKVKTWGIRLPKSIARLATQMDDEIAAVTAETEEQT
jgi:ParB family chromosome partitioning protein